MTTHPVISNTDNSETALHWIFKDGQRLAPVVTWFRMATIVLRVE